MPNPIRQGDLALIPTTETSNGTRKKGRAKKHTLAVGEDSGHSHVIAKALRFDDTLVLLDSSELRVEPAPMAWRHDALPVPAGAYRIVIQREYTPAAIVRVQD